LAGTTITIASNAEQVAAELRTIAQRCRSPHPQGWTLKDQGFVVDIVAPRTSVIKDLSGGWKS